MFFQLLWQVVRHILDLQEKKSRLSRMQQFIGVPLALARSCAQVNIRFLYRHIKKAFQKGCCSSLAPELEKAGVCI